VRLAPDICGVESHQTVEKFEHLGDPHAGRHLAPQPKIPSIFCQKFSQKMESIKAERLQDSLRSLFHVEPL